MRPRKKVLIIGGAAGRAAELCWIAVMCWGYRAVVLAEDCAGEAIGRFGPDAAVVAEATCLELTARRIHQLLPELEIAALVASDGEANRAALAWATPIRLGPEMKPQVRAWLATAVLRRTGPKPRTKRGTDSTRGAAYGAREGERMERMVGL